MIEEKDKMELEIKRKLSIVARTMRNLYPFFLIFSSISIIIIISLILLAKTQSFRHWSSGLILNLVNNELQEGARFEFDDINFSYLLGFRIDNARLIVKNDTLLHCKYLHTGLSVLPLLRNKVIVKEILIVNPKFNIHRSAKDSIWNFEKIFIATTDTAPSEQIDWLVRLDRFRIKDGSAKYYDSTVALRNNGKMDYDHLNLKDFNINVKGEINLQNFTFDFDLEKLSFKELNSKFTIKNISSKIKIDTTGIKINDFELETDKIDIAIDASLNSINIFSENADFNKAKFKVESTTDKISLTDVSKFLPENIDFIGNLEFDLFAEGEFKNFKVILDNFKIDDTELNLKTRLVNIGDSTRKIFLYMTDSYVAENDLNKILKTFDVSGIPNFVTAKIPELKVKYMTDSLKADFDVRSELGNVKGNVDLGFAEKFSYSGKLKTEKINIAKIVNDKALTSNLNTSIEFSGEGVELDEFLLKLKLEMLNSSFAGYEFSKTILDFQTPEKGIFIIDSLFVELARRYDTVTTTQRTNRRQNQSLFLSGNLNLKNPDKPIYKLYTKINSVRPARFFDNDKLPTVIDAVLLVEGEGLDPDEIQANINLKIDRWRYARKNLTPAEFDIDIAKSETGDRSISLKSKIINMESKGKFKINSLVDLLSYHSTKLTDFIYDKISQVTVNSLPYESNSLAIKPNTDDIDLNVKMEFKDLEYIKAFLGFEEFKVMMNADFNLSSTNGDLKLDLTSFNIPNFSFDDSTQKVRCSEIKLSGDVSLNSSGLYNPELNLNISAGQPVFIDKNYIKDISSIITFKNDNLHFSGSAGFNDQLSFATEFNAEITDKKIDFVMDTLNFKLSDKLDLTNLDEIRLSYQNEIVEIKNFKIAGKNFKSIELSGKAGLEKFDNLTLKINEYNIEEIWKIIPEEESQYSEMIKGKIDSLNVTVNGSMQNTDIDLKLSASDLHINGRKLGNITAELEHRNSNLSGSLSAFYISENENRNLMNVNIKKLPLNLSIDSEEDRFSENKPIALSFETKRFPLDYLSPFVSDVKNLRGYADIKLDITGDNMKGIDYNGSISYDKTGFHLEANNMSYLSEGKITIKKDDIHIEKISLKNENSDLPNGEVVAQGHIFLDDLEPKSMDIKLSSRRFKIMSQATMKSMPTLYGDFIVSFGPKPLHIYGNIEEPSIRGDLNIVRATLNMPNLASTEVKKSKLKYEFLTNDNVEFTFIDDPLQKPSGKIETKKVESNHQSSTSNQLDIDIGVRFLGRFIVTMDITEMGQLFAEIGAATNEDVLRYVQQRGSDEPKIYGTDIIVKNGSTLKLIKIFETTGTVSFPTGSVSNPGLDLKAVYHGQRVVSEKTKSYDVNMYIKGTKDSPIITFGYSEDGITATGDSSKINEDALLLLTFGKTKEDFQNAPSGMNNNLQKNAGQIASNLTSSMASSFASSALTDFLQTTGFIQNVEIDMGNSLASLDQARLKWSGDIYGIKYTLGGTVADFANNNEISFDFPLIARSNIPWLNHFIFQLTKATVNAQQSTSINKKDWEIKLKLGGSW